MSFNGFSKRAFIEGNMSAKQCISVLRYNLFDSALKLKILNLYYFQQENDSKHPAYITR